jgi:hypothetical protein
MLVAAAAVKGPNIETRDPKRPVQAIDAELANEAEPMTLTEDS